MEFDEHEDPDEEMEIPGQTSSGGYETLPNPHPAVAPTAVEGAMAGGIGGRKPSASVRYRECLKNHAVGIGGNAVDGCGEFMAAGEEGTLDALRCAACNCHRNFHRKEVDGATDAGGGSGGGGGGGVATALMFHHVQPHHPHHQFSPYYRAAPPPAGYLHITPPRPLALPAASGGGTHSREELEDVSNPSSSGGGGGSGSGAMAMMSIMKKRHRTKFTAEQKEKMLSFAERLGWRIQKHDDAAVEQFCSETGVKRQVLKIWMHNNKHTLGKKPSDN